MHQPSLLPVLGDRAGVDLVIEFAPFVYARLPVETYRLTWVSNGVRWWVARARRFVWLLHRRATGAWRCI
jgi:hypothetical protein